MGSCSVYGIAELENLYFPVRVYGRPKHPHAESYNAAIMSCQRREVALCATFEFCTFAARCRTCSSSQPKHEE